MKNLANKKFEDVIEYTDNKEGGKKREYKRKYYPKKNRKEIPKNQEDVKGDVDSDGFEIVGSKEEKKQKLRDEHRGEYVPRRGRGKWRRNKFWKRRDYENEKKYLISEFLLCLSLCHTVLIDNKKRKEILQP